MAMRYLFFVLTVAVCCACSCAVTAEAESTPGGVAGKTAAQKPASDKNLHGESMALEDTKEGTPCDATTGEGEKPHCKGTTKAKLHQENGGPGAGKENNISTDLQAHPMQPGSAGSSSTQVREDQVQLEDHQPEESEESLQDGGIKEGMEQRADNQVQEQTASPPQTVTPGTPQTPSDTDRVKSPEETQSSHEENDKRGANDAQRNTQP
ncbi:uncharacterized protein TM35_001331020, partial [Trypanosoma theileri]